MEILEQLGIDGKLLLAQAVNFLILLFILYRFVYKPMLDFLEKRTERIEKGLRDAEESGRRLSKATEREEEILSDARKEAKKLLSDATASAESRGAELLAEFGEKAQRIIAEAEERATAERERLFREAKGEIAGLVISTTEKVLREKLPAGEKGNVTKFIG